MTARPVDDILTDVYRFLHDLGRREVEPTNENAPDGWNPPEAQCEEKLCEPLDSQSIWPNVTRLS